MKNVLSVEDRTKLKNTHRSEQTKRTADRMKAVLLSDDGWTHRQIGKALFLDEQTVAYEYLSDEKLSIESGGSESKLNDEESSELISHLESNIYATVNEIRQHVFCKYATLYTTQGMTSWLHNHRFSYKKPKGIPAKANSLEQEVFIEKYKNIKEKSHENEPILFLDAVHPTMATKVVYGWMRVGKSKSIKTTGSRTRVNLVGSLELRAMKLLKRLFDRVNSKSIVKFFKHVKLNCPKAARIHIILDNSSYNSSSDVIKAAKELNIQLHFLPPYSPNLNPIERVWKVANEFFRNNAFFSSGKEFREKLIHFFEVTWDKISHSLRKRINDNFQLFDSTVLT